MKLYKLRKLQTRRNFVQGRYHVGIDPAKARHQAQILDPACLPVGTTFSFTHSFTGFHHQLWERLAVRHPDLAHLARTEFSSHLVFAVEASCNLWANLVDNLQRSGCRVVLVSPLSTCHARPSTSGDFSRTDPQDAYLVADLARAAASTSTSSTSPRPKRCTAWPSPTTSSARACTATTLVCVRCSN